MYSVCFMFVAVAPSQPRELQAPRSGITSRSLQLQWKKPDPSNGNIQFYRVYLWEKLKPSTSSTITREIPTPDDSLSTNVTRLSPSTAYWVSIAAVNVEDGNELVGEQTSHKDIKVKTLDEGKHIYTTTMLMIVVHCLVSW